LKIKENASKRDKSYLRAGKKSKKENLKDSTYFTYQKQATRWLDQRAEMPPWETALDGSN